MILMHDDCIVGDAFVCGSDGDGNSGIIYKVMTL